MRTLNIKDDKEFSQQLLFSHVSDAYQVVRYHMLQASTTFTQQVKEVHPQSGSILK